MPEGIVRTDLNRTGVTFKDGTPITTPHNFGNPVTWPTPDPKHFGNLIPATDPTFNSNPVTWPTPNPAFFGNDIGGGGQGSSGFELEDGSGLILLEDGNILLLEVQI